MNLDNVFEILKADQLPPHGNGDETSGPEYVLMAEARVIRPAWASDCLDIRRDDRSGMAMMMVVVVLFDDCACGHPWISGTCGAPGRRCLRRWRKVDSVWRRLGRWRLGRQRADRADHHGVRLRLGIHARPPEIKNALVA